MSDLIWAIRNGRELKVAGPAPSWQMACLAAFGIIDSQFEVKCLGDNQFKVNKKKWLDSQISDRTGWFRPMIRDSELGVTLTPEDALGPMEILKIMLVLGDRMKNGDVESAWKEGQQYLPYLPVTVCAKFSDLYNTYREIRDANTLEK